MSRIIPDGGERERARTTESTRWKESLLRLKQQESLMERSLANWMESMKLEPEVLRLVLRDAADISRKRELFLDNMKKSLEEITEELKSVRAVVDSPERIENLDTNAYKRRLVQLSQKIRNFKESCQLESLSQEQTTLESELREFELNLHKYESPIGDIDKSTSAIASSNKENKKCQENRKEIQDFHALIAKTGHTDNWNEEDHSLFLRTRKRCSNIPALVAAVQVKCPDLTAAAIVNHEAWYKIYVQLREKQRSSVREWRERRELEKSSRRGCDEKPAAEVADEISREKTESGVASASKRETRKTKSSGDVDDASRKKELIRQWRAERERKRSIDSERSRMLTESRLAAQEKRRRERSRRIQETLAQHRERKSLEVSSGISEGDPRARKCDPTLMKAFRKQDEEYTKRKRDLIARLNGSAKNETARIVRSRAAKARDFSTLLNPTEVWRERCKTQEQEMLGARKPRELQYIKDVPRRLHVRDRNGESTEIKDVLKPFS